MREIDNLQNRNRAINLMVENIDHMIRETETDIIDLQNYYHKQRTLHQLVNRTFYTINLVKDLDYCGEEVYEETFKHAEFEDEISEKAYRLQDLKTMKRILMVEYLGKQPEDE